MQEFLSQLRWDEDRLRDRLQQLVAAEHAGPHTIGIIDETSDPKKGDKTPGVQKQWCGRLGKTENCIVTVHLGFARDDFHCLLDGELFLPESWADDRDRCREAGIPDEVVYRPKWKIALELYDRAVANGLRFDWLTFDEGYGSKPEFLRELTGRGQLVRRRGAAELHRLARPAAGRHPAVSAKRTGTRPQGPPPGQRQPAGPAGRRDARRPAAAGPALAAVPRQGRRERGRWSGNVST